MRRNGFAVWQRAIGVLCLIAVAGCGNQAVVERDKALEAEKRALAAAEEATKAAEEARQAAQAAEARAAAPHAHSEVTAHDSHGTAHDDHGTATPVSTARKEPASAHAETASVDHAEKVDHDHAHHHNDDDHSHGEAKSPADEARAALNDLIATVEAKNYRKLLTHYMPVERFRAARDGEGIDAMVGRARPQEMNQVVEMLKVFQGTDPEIDSSGLVARFRLKPPAPAEENHEPEPVAVDDPLDDHLDLQGFGDDFDQAINSAVAFLEEEKVDQFIQRMFPAGELGRLQADKQLDTLLARLKANPPMVKQMLEDLKAVQNEQPKFDENKTVATVVIPVKRPDAGGRRDTRPDPKPKTFRFQLVAGNWRFFDNSTDVRKEMKRVGKLAPIKVEIPEEEPTELVLEKLGDSWRVAKFPDPR